MGFEDSLRSMQGFSVTSIATLVLVIGKHTLLLERLSHVVLGKLRERIGIWWADHSFNTPEFTTVVIRPPAMWYPIEQSKNSRRPWKCRGQQ